MEKEPPMLSNEETHARQVNIPNQDSTETIQPETNNALKRFVTPNGSHEVVAIPTSIDGSTAPLFVHTPLTRRGARYRSQGNKANNSNDEICCDCTPLCQRLSFCYRFIPFNIWSIWCVKDPCGLICAIFTWLLIFFAQFVIQNVLFSSIPSQTFVWINGTIFYTFASIAVISHVRAMFSDPGTVPLHNATREKILQMGFREGQVIFRCPKCCSIKPERSHHCSICGRCVRKMDHHCPWVNNCVGEANQKYFILFTAYICIMSVHAIYMCIHYFIMCVPTEFKECHGGYGVAATTTFLIFLILEGLLFGLFTAFIFADQIQAVWSDTTGIESLKKESITWERRFRWLGMESVFGHPRNWRWFLPLAPSLGGIPRHKLSSFMHTV